MKRRFFNHCLCYVRSTPQWPRGGPLKDAIVFSRMLRNIRALMTGIVHQPRAEEFGGAKGASAPGPAAATAARRHPVAGLGVRQVAHAQRPVAVAASLVGQHLVRAPPIPLVTVH